MNKKYILRIQSPDQKGLIYKITSLLFELEFNIEKNNEYVNNEDNIFFFRAEFSGTTSIAGLKEKLCAILPENTFISLEESRKKNVVIFCTKEYHCLGDLLLKHESKEINCHIQAIISNHENLRKLSERFEIPFYYISSTRLLRSEHEEKILNLLQSINEEYTIDYIILAKYMRILSAHFVKHYWHKIINIHHSLLPAFIGANPYKQAYHKGAKIIGATAHFVTENLDEGPIITQNIIEVNHTYSIHDMQKAGRDIEKNVLAKAIELVLNDRVFIHNNKTVIF